MQMFSMGIVLGYEAFHDFFDPSLSMQDLEG